MADCATMCLMYLMSLSATGGGLDNLAPPLLWLGLRTDAKCTGLSW